jgi:flagellar basal-body rod protein FlgB
MPVKSLFGKTYQVLERSLQIAGLRHGVIASNVANVATPDYKARNLDFDKTLNDALEKRSVDVVRTHPRHFGVPRLGTVDYEITDAEQPGVDIDMEMSRLAENNLRYQTGIELLLKKYAGLKHAITEGGR